MQQGANVVCGVSSPSQGATTVRSIEQPAELWDAEDPINGLGNVIVTLLNHVPLVIGLTITKGFDSPTTDGYVRLRGNRFKLCREVAIDPNVPDVTGCEQTDDCECPMGGHAVLAVGYIPQAKLPPGTLNSTGGFLIIKNSWGCVADGGYSTFRPPGPARSSTLRGPSATSRWPDRCPTSRWTTSPSTSGRRRR